VRPDSQEAADHRASLAALTAVRDQMEQQDNEIRNLEGLVRFLSRLLAYEFSQFLHSLRHISLEPADRKQECSICILELGDQVLMTACGHFFCTSCIKEWVASNPTCPVCVKPIKPDLSDTNAIQPVEDPATKYDLKVMINKYGTKMAHVIRCIVDVTESDADARIIVFSQWSVRDICIDFYVSLVHFAFLT
jgi:hypothetical protein